MPAGRYWLEVRAGRPGPTSAFPVDRLLWGVIRIGCTTVNHSAPECITCVSRPVVLSVRARAWSDTTFERGRARSQEKGRRCATHGYLVRWFVRKVRARKCDARIQAVARRFARSYKQYQARTFSESELL